MLLDIVYSITVCNAIHEINVNGLLGSTFRFSDFERVKYDLIETDQRNWELKYILTSRAQAHGPHKNCYGLDYNHFYFNAPQNQTRVGDFVVHRILFIENVIKIHFQINQIINIFCSGILILSTVVQLI